MRSVTALADRIEAALARRGWTMYRLGKESGVSQSYLSWLMSGEGERVGGEKAEQTARTLGVTMEWLLTGDGPMVPPEQAQAVCRLSERDEWPNVARAVLEMRVTWNTSKICSGKHMPLDI